MDLRPPAKQHDIRGCADIREGSLDALHATTAVAKEAAHYHHAHFKTEGYVQLRSVRTFFEARMSGVEETNFDKDRKDAMQLLRYRYLSHYLRTL